MQAPFLLKCKDSAKFRINKRYLTRIAKFVDPIILFVKRLFMTSSKYTFQNADGSVLTFRILFYFYRFKI